MPVSNFTKLYKMVPIAITTPSYSGGKTGDFYDALVPLLAANLAGTKYVYAEYVAPSVVGDYALNFSQAGQSVSVKASVINNQLVPNPVNLNIAVINSFLTSGHYGKYVNGSEALGIPYVKEAVAHRITPYNSYVVSPPVTNGLLDFNAMGSLSFQKNVLDFVPTGFMLPNFSTVAQLQAAEATVKGKNLNAWFYTRDEPPSSDFASVNAQIDLQKANAPSIKTMVTKEFSTAIHPDIFAPVIDYFAVPQYQGGPMMPNEAAYAGKELWLYTSCMEHGCGADRNGNVNAAKVSGGSSGAPGFIIDREAANIYAFIAVPFVRYKSVKGLLYYNSVEQYKLYSQGVDVWKDQFNFGGNGDGTLFYPLRAGMYGNTVEQPAVSIRMKTIRSAEYLMDYANQGKAFIDACNGGALITDSRNFDHNAADFKAFRECLISKLGF
jgi:hypothetical protein